MPELAELSKQIIIDQTPEGLRIQLVDQEGRSMFNQGSATPNDRAKILLRAVAKVINQLPNRISISGHTSANADGAKPTGDWTLSAGRADASRQILQGAGVDADRVYQVSGKADVRSALSRRSDPARQPPHRHRAVARGAGAAARSRPLADARRALARSARHDA